MGSWDIQGVRHPLTLITSGALSLVALFIIPPSLPPISLYLSPTLSPSPHSLSLSLSPPSLLLSPPSPPSLSLSISLSGERCVWMIDVSHSSDVVGWLLS